MNREIIEFKNAYADVIERLAGYDLYQRTGFNLPENLLENVPTRLYPTTILCWILENADDDTNVAVKEEIGALWAQCEGAGLFYFA